MAKKKRERIGKNQYYVLEAIGDEYSAKSSTLEIYGKLGLDRSQLRRTIKSLEKRGFVTVQSRNKDSTNRVDPIVKLTKKAKKEFPEYE